MNELSKRLITGSLYIIVLTAAIIYGPWSLAILFLAFALCSLYEFQRMASVLKFKVQNFATYTATLVLFISGSGAYLFPDIDFPFIKLSLLILPIYIFILLQNLFGHEKVKLENAAISMAALFYVALPFALAVPVSYFHGVYHWEILLGTFVMIWSSDSFAFVTGKMFGRTKLFERISPKKTWEGFIGGTVLTIAASFAVSYFFDVLSPMQWAGIGFIASVFGTLGDLVESMFKRQSGVKDSGNILPGHGGILDRLDSYMLAIPLVYVYLSFL